MPTLLSRHGAPSAPDALLSKRALSARHPSRAIDVGKLNTQVGQGHQLLSPDAGTTSPLMQGSFSMTRLRDGMSLHCTDIVHLHDMATQFVMQEECIKVLLKLEGNAQVAVGRQSLPLDAGEGANAVPHGSVVTLNAPDTFERHACAGSRQRMVVLTLKPVWFDATGISREIFREHLTVRHWTPTPRAVAIAEQLIHPLGLDDPMQSLYQESRALELIAEALSRTRADTAPSPLTMSASACQRVRRLQQLLDSGEADQLDMRAIAQSIGCNANTLQQQFRQVCGQPIFDYLRQRRLQRAAHALQHEGVSVARAAEIAGYSSQANFSTAFRRNFGLQPKHCRNRL
ncbi:AraC family transcriptional regulator [Polaromonas hydrogenivorans]|uniref:AraC family transcriptional regulator n=1 Tax=Polaromonas hydrogenivorans TaxID=335476 RepID=A0AAU7LQF4_9BURK